MKKRVWIVTVLIIGMLFSGFTRIERDVPSPNFGSKDTVFDGFTVPVPDYYQRSSDNENLFGYLEDGSHGTGLLIGSAKIKESEKAMMGMKRAAFEKLMDEMNAGEPDQVEDIRVAGLPAVRGYYKDRQLCAVLVFNEDDREILMMCLLTTPGSAYGSYEKDFMRMADGIRVRSSRSGADGVSPEVKAFWDSYEAFVDEYIELLKNPYDIKAIGKLGEFMTKYSEFEKKAKQYSDRSKYSSADVAYSLEVGGRLLTKLAGLL